MSDELVDDYVAALDKHHARKMARKRLREKIIQWRIDWEFKKYLRKWLKLSFLSSSQLKRRVEISTVTNSRAYSLLRNRYLCYPLGPFIVEYQVNSLQVSSFYSMNQGLDFHFYFETELRGSFDDYINFVSLLMISTEAGLLGSIETKKPPHYPKTYAKGFSAYVPLFIE